jgi:hypothetical protein
MESGVIEEQRYERPFEQADAKDKRRGLTESLVPEHLSIQAELGIRHVTDPKPTPIPIMIILPLLGYLLAAIGGIWLLVRMFQEKGALHGILGFFCGLYLLIWALSNMGSANLKKPLLIWLVGIILVVVGSISAANDPALKGMIESQLKEQGIPMPAPAPESAPAPVQQ